MARRRSTWLSTSGMRSTSTWAGESVEGRCGAVVVAGVPASPAWTLRGRSGGFLGCPIRSGQGMAGRSGRCGALLCSVPMFGMGFGELLVVLVIVLLVFGPGCLPEMMGNLGKAMREFQKGLREPPEIEKPPESDDPSKTSRET